MVKYIWSLNKFNRTKRQFETLTENSIENALRRKNLSVRKSKQNRNPSEKFHGIPRRNSISKVNSEISSAQQKTSDCIKQRRDTKRQSVPNPKFLESDRQGIIQTIFLSVHRFGRRTLSITTGQLIWKASSVRAAAISYCDVKREPSARARKTRDAQHPTIYGETASKAPDGLRNRRWWWTSRPDYEDGLGTSSGMGFAVCGTRRPDNGTIRIIECGRWNILCLINFQIRFDKIWNCPMRYIISW